jgi:cell division protein FtsB
MFGIKKTSVQDMHNKHENVIEKIQSLRQAISAHKTGANNAELSQIRSENEKLKEINSKINARLEALEKEASKGLFAKDMPSSAKRSSTEITCTEDELNPKTVL